MCGDLSARSAAAGTRSLSEPSNMTQDVIRPFVMRSLCTLLTGPVLVQFDFPNEESLVRGRGGDDGLFGMEIYLCDGASVSWKSVFDRS